MGIEKLALNVLKAIDSEFKCLISGCLLSDDYEPLTEVRETAMAMFGSHLLPETTNAYRYHINHGMAEFVEVRDEGSHKPKLEWRLNNNGLKYLQPIARFTLKKSSELGTSLYPILYRENPLEVIKALEFMNNGCRYKDEILENTALTNKEALSLIYTLDHLGVIEKYLQQNGQANNMAFNKNGRLDNLVNSYLIPILDFIKNPNNRTLDAKLNREDVIRAVRNYRKAQMYSAK